MWRGGAEVVEGGFWSGEGPSNLQQRIDYVARTDGQPVYVGFALKGIGTDKNNWIIQMFTYTTIAGNDCVVARQSSVGSWDNRAVLVYS